MHRILILAVSLTLAQGTDDFKVMYLTTDTCFDSSIKLSNSQINNNLGFPNLHN